MSLSAKAVLLLLGVVLAQAEFVRGLGRELAEERRAVDVLQRAFVSYSGLQGRPPVLVVSNRNYTERTLYHYAKGDPEASPTEMATKLDCHNPWIVDETVLSRSERKRIRDDAVRVILTQARLMNQDAIGLKKVLDAVLFRYSEPFPGTENSADFSWPVLSMPSRVDRARYEGTPCWIVTCYGLARPFMEFSDFSVPVSLDGKILVPKWREEGIQ